MGKIIQFPKEYYEEFEDREENELDKIYKEFYSDPKNCESQDEYLKGRDYAVGKDGRIVNLW